MPEPSDIAEADVALSDGARAFVGTCERMIREKIPNLFRLYLNPYVAQACHCINEMITSAWPAAAAAKPYQVFLANGMEEALSGAIKLARYTANAAGRRGPGLVFDPDDRLEHFAATDLPGLGKLEYLPNVAVTSNSQTVVAALSGASTSGAANAPSFVVVFLSTLLDAADAVARRLGNLSSDDSRPLVIVCVSRQQLFHWELPLAQDQRMPLPDIVVFDESFVDDAVPFGAFAASKSLYEPWNQGSMATFHSTTYQPNTISTLHFLRSLEAAQPAFFAQQSAALARLAGDIDSRQACFRELYSPSLAKLISVVDLDQTAMTASGHYVDVPGRRLFDGVAGVACSVRGHNPESYVAELMESGDLDVCREEVVERLHVLTGLPHAVPAVSGASAVEHALKMGLATRFPRTHVLALQGGYGGKTLFALTGTAKPALKAGLEPLYPNVVYVDPFGADAIATIDAAFERYPIGVVQLELVQGVGGVRAVPPAVLEHLRMVREKHDCLLFVDEVQTGVYRTGPFARSIELGIEPDLLAIGKGTSDMIFPFAMTLHSEAVARTLEARGCSMPELFGTRYGYEIGYRTLIGTLRRAEAEGLEEQVLARSELLATSLAAELKGCAAVREVRCFGMLIGIELNVERFRNRRLKRLASNLYLLAMLHHRSFPLVVGFCQYEPNVLKLTPPLSITAAEVRGVCHTISSVLRRSLVRLAAEGLFHSIIRPRLKRLRRLFGSSAP